MEGTDSEATMWLRRSALVALPTGESVRIQFLHRPAAAGHSGAAAPALLMLHGLLASAETFTALAREVPPQHAIYALDLPGNAEPASGGQRELSFAALAALVVRFAAGEGAAGGVGADGGSFAPPVLVGHSHGGALALEILSTQPRFAAGAVLLCPAHPELRRERKLVRFYLSPLGSVVAFLLPMLPRPWQAIGFRYVLGKRGRARRVAFGPYRAALTDRVLVKKALRMIRNWEADMETLGRALVARPPQLPLLLLWGAEDAVVPAHTAAWMEQVFPDAQSVVLSGVGHLPNDEAPEECGVLLRGWMRRHGLTPDRGTTVAGTK